MGDIAITVFAGILGLICFLAWWDGILKAHENTKPKKYINVEPKKDNWINKTISIIKDERI
jgi:hypothetical protein